MLIMRESLNFLRTVETPIQNVLWLLLPISARIWNFTFKAPVFRTNTRTSKISICIICTFPTILTRIWLIFTWTSETIDAMHTFSTIFARIWLTYIDLTFISWNSRLDKSIERDLYQINLITVDPWFSDRFGQQEKCH